MPRMKSAKVFKILSEGKRKPKHQGEWIPEEVSYIVAASLTEATTKFGKQFPKKPLVGVSLHLGKVLS